MRASVCGVWGSTTWAQLRDISSSLTPRTISTAFLLQISLRPEKLCEALLQFTPLNTLAMGDADGKCGQCEPPLPEKTVLPSVPLVAPWLLDMCNPPGPSHQGVTQTPHTLVTPRSITQRDNPDP